MSENVIQIDSLSKIYGKLFWKKKEAALDNLTISIPKGKVLGFLGPNGAGKTTTIKLIMDLIKPSNGTIQILNSTVDDIKVKERIGFLPDSPAFSPHMSANEFLNVCAKLYKMPSDRRKLRIVEVLEIVKMSQHAKSKMKGFSKGMLQRIGIAQAILNDPDLLVLDEPLVGLDPHGRQELKQIILDQKEKGTSVLFCSHILSDVETICDNIAIMNKGELLCSGTIDELLSDTGYKLTITPGNDSLATQFLADSRSSSKLENGTWELTFDTDKEKGLRSFVDKNPETMILSSSKESLEDFFFRKIEKITDN